jgi:ferredoxin
MLLNIRVKPRIGCIAVRYIASRNLGSRLSPVECWRFRTPDVSGSTAFVHTQPAKAGTLNPHSCAAFLILDHRLLAPVALGSVTPLTPTEKSIKGYKAARHYSCDSLLHCTYCAEIRSLMADVANKYPESVAGKYYVDNQCIDCDLCRETAPDNFKRNDDGGYSFVYKQPENPEEEARCKEAKEGCPVEAIGDNGA